MTSEREITPPPVFSAMPTTTTTFAATTSENTPLAYRASTSTNPNPVISPAFVKANCETLESLLRDRRRQMRNNDLRTGFEYFSEDYDEEREMEARPRPARAVTPPLQAASPRVRKIRERVVGFEETQNRGESRVERNIEGGRPSEEASRGNGSQNANLPPLLAAHIGRSENGQPLQSSLTSAYRGQALPNNIGGNLPHKAHGLPFENSDGKPPIGGSFANLPRGGNVPSTFTNGNILPQNGFMHPVNIPSNSYPFYTLPMYTFPNMPAYANPNSAGLFPNPLGSVAPFICWIEDCPLPDRLKMPSHIGQLSHSVKGIKKEKAKSTDTPEGKARKTKYPEQMVTIGKQLPEHFKKELQNLLRANADIFAWTHVDMTGISRTIMVDGKPGKPFKTEHKLNEYSHIMPIKKNKRSLSPDRNVAARKEAKELTKVGILRKVKHQTWVANPVMVKKNDGGWRMCVDFTYKNKACPKDCYPLPEIDWKIESLAGFHLKCFLDAYKGYHQIQMAEGDEDKTAFFVGEGVFCYGKMPFGLKNTGATTYEEGMLSDIQETFERFRSINMKLNPKKCSFGVEEGSFLGHLITKQGIKANPSKIKVVIELEQPRALKDIQSLNKKLAALSRFLSKEAERSLPFFKGVTRDRTQLPCTKKAYIGIGACSKKASKILSSSHDNGSHSEKRVKEKKVSYPSNEWKLYTNRASSSDGVGVGLMLIDPTGLRIAREMEITKVAIFLDSKLVVNQIKGTYAAKQLSIKSYWQKVKTTLKGFEGYIVQHVRRNQNKNADALSKLASMTFEHLTKEVLVEVLAKRSIEEKEVLKVKIEQKRSWMSPIQEYLLSVLLPKDTKEAKKIRIQVPQYKLIRGNPYKISFFTLCLHCIAPPQTDKIIKEIHEGSCGFNAKPRSMVVRITKQGYYWPSMHMEVAKTIQDCDKCKEQSAIRKARMDEAITVESTWPFSYWGIHILGPLLMDPGGDFVLFPTSSQEQQGPHMISDVHKDEFYTLVSGWRIGFKAGAEDGVASWEEGTSIWVLEGTCFCRVGVRMAKNPKPNGEIQNLKFLGRGEACLLGYGAGRGMVIELRGINRDSYRVRGGDGA
uniref:Reverse transcriptase domain-containing protein n=1 Tax=Tanacetum cinerariifolium TaxID=118510 RepID=A0A6L2K533_TANCI|nr:reverse transcriptase domain-containing protein [Tanacetum cinerariifolium]